VFLFNIYVTMVMSPSTCLCYIW